jgi:ABC-type Fe3+/spermidine/putrescine transport system ATPase subunit
VTHDQAEALSMADRIAVMRRGRLVQVGTPHELYTRPESAFVAEFIGGTNLLRGTLEEVGEISTVKTEAGIVLAKNGAKGIARGTAVLCSVRPESLCLISAEESSGQRPAGVTNELFAEVQSIMYLGDNEQYTLRVADNTIVRAVEYNQPARKAQVGDRLALRFDARAVVVLPEEELGD